MTRILSLSLSLFTTTLAVITSVQWWLYRGVDNIHTHTLWCMWYVRAHAHTVVISYLWVYWFFSSPVWEHGFIISHYHMCELLSGSPCVLITHTHTLTHLNTHREAVERGRGIPMVSVKPIMEIAFITLTLSPPASLSLFSSLLLLSAFYLICLSGCIHPSFLSTSFPPFEAFFSIPLFNHPTTTFSSPRVL